MTKYSARIRQLEAKLRPGECRACGDGQQVSVEMVELLEGQPEPELPPKLCEVCGKSQKRVVWIISQPLPRSEQPAAASVISPSAAAPRVAARGFDISSPPNQVDISTSPKPRVKRRRYSGE